MCIVTVCIVTSHRHRQLAACLGSVSSQEDAPPYEILVCANDDPDVDRLVGEQAHSARILHAPRTNLGAARNLLIQQATGELLLFLDDDVVVDRRLLARFARSAREHPDVMVFGGPNLTPPGSTRFQVAGGAVLGSLIGAGPVRRRYGRHPVGLADERFFTLCNLAIRRSAMTAFPSDVTGGEENAVLIELARREGAMLYDPHLAVFHERRSTLRPFATQMHKYGSGRGQVIARDLAGLRPAYLAPVALIAYLVTLPLLLGLVGPVAGAPLVVYVVVVLATALKAGWPMRDPRVTCIAAFLIPVVHLCYGVGLLRGVVMRRAGGGRRHAVPQHRRELFTNLVRRQRWLRRKRSALARVLPVLSPFILMVVYVFVVRRVFKVPIQRYPEFLLCGLLPWSFLTVALTRSASSVSSEGDLLRKAPFAVELLPLSAVAAHAIDFVAAMGLFVGWLVISGQHHLSMLPLLILPMFAVVFLVMGLAMLLSLIDVHTHDLRYLLGNLLTIWFFLVPIVYRPAMAPQSVQFLRSVDPMSLIVGQMRSILMVGRIEEPAQLGWMLVACAAVFLVALAIFRSRAVDLAKDV